MFGSSVGVAGQQSRPISEFLFSHKTRFKLDQLETHEPRRRSEDHVVILLAMLNGEPCLPDQLFSIRRQTHSDWSLVVSDDGSRDDSKHLVDCFARGEKDRDVTLIDGPGQGFAANFMHLLGRVGEDAAYAAFSDQDDVWLPQKLEHAISRLRSEPSDVPAVYCGRTWVCSATLRRMQLSKLFRQGPSFRNAIVQSIGGGNTMVLNRAAIDLIQRASRDCPRIASHDWWAYQVVSGAGGTVLYDETPLVLYRQHDGNVIGAGDSLWATLGRLLLVLKGQFKAWNDANLDALERSRHLLTPHSKEVLDSFGQMREASLARRLLEGVRSGIHHQTLPGNAGLLLALVLKRL